MLRNNEGFYVEREFETGINWCIEARRYIWTPTLWSRFNKTTYYEIDVKNFGEFYFPEIGLSLPSDTAPQLKEFVGYKIFDWIKDNVTSRTEIYCFRNYSIDYDYNKMSISFHNKLDATGFKMWW